MSLKSSTNTKSTSIFWKIFLGFIPVFVFVLIMGLIKFQQISTAIAEGMKQGPPVAAVTSSKVNKERWQSIIRTVGSLESVQGSMLSAEANGRVSSIPIQDGARIKKGDLILELDSAVENAEYETAKAQSDLLKKTYDRQKRLFEAKVISADEHDTSNLNYKAALSNMEALKAKVARRQIRAPFDGVLGVRRVNIGQYVREGDPLIPLQNINDTYISFALSQNDAMKVSLEDSMDVEYDSKKPPLKAKITAIDPSISMTSKTALLKAKLTEESKVITPGMFINLKITLSEEFDYFAIPSTSIQYAPYGDSVFILEKSTDKDGNEVTIANPSFVKIADQRGDLVAIKSGLEVGQEIATSGIFKLSPGAKVFINNEVQPDAKLNPRPVNR